MDRNQYWTYQRLVQEFEKTDQATLDLFRNVPSGERALNRYKQIVEQDQNYFEMRDPADPTGRILAEQCKIDGLPLGWEMDPHGKGLNVNHFGGPHSRAQGGGVPLEPAHAMEGKPGWCQFIQYDQRNRHGPRRLFYYHKSSKTFQWQNPTLLRKELFVFSAPDGSNRGPINQLPRGWVSRIVQRFDPATQAPIQSATVYFNTRTQMSTYSDPRAYLSKVDMLIRWNAMNAQMFKQHLFLPRKPDDPMDEARMKLKKPGDKVDRKSLVYPEDWFKPIEAIVAQFAHWSTEELHPHYMKTLIEGAEMAQDVTGVTRNAIPKMAEHFFDKFVHLFDERGYGAFDIAPWTVSKDKHPPHTDHSKGTLPLYYAFGRFLGWVLFLNRPNVHGFQLCVDVGTTVTYPLTGTDQLPLDMLQRIYEGMSEWVNDPYLNLKKHKEFPYRVPVNDDDANDPVGFERRVRLLYTIYSNMTSFTFRYEFLEPNEKGLTIVEKLKDYEILKDLDLAPGETYDTIPLAQIEEHYHKSTRLDEKWITKDCFGRQANAIKNGFKDVIPLEWLRLFDAEEFQVLLCGENGIITVEELKEAIFWSWHPSLATVVTSPEQRADFEDTFITKLAAKLENKAFRQNFLHFSIGMTRPPPGGLTAMNPPFKFKMVDRIRPGDDDALLWAHVCSQGLDINYTMIQALLSGAATPEAGWEEVMTFIGYVTNLSPDQFNTA